jgi:aminoglycoside phosphotransferase family enzyme
MHQGLKRVDALHETDPFANTDGSAPSLADKVRLLQTPAAYPDRPTAVEAKETHMSWVFLTDRYVYKLKKSVRYPYLDFSTLAAREAACRDEVRLNRRLAPDTYLGVRALTRRADGTLAIGGDGAVIDWLVHMRRLPGERMLDAVIARGALTDGDVEALGTRLGDFYAGLPAADLAPDAFVEGFRREQAENLRVLEQRAFAVDGERLDSVTAPIARFLDRRCDLLRQRVREGRVVEGHGDLRPEHVCLLDPPIMMDCLEFNRLLRLIDPFDEIAYLGLECERLGAAWVGPKLRSMLEQRLGDRPDDLVIAFYTAFRACLRARLALAHLLEPAPRTPERWPAMARAYLAIAERAARSL